MVPSRTWTWDLIALKAMPLHIVRHSLTVRRVAITLAGCLADQSLIDIRLVDRAALLHDICKADSIAAGGDHARMGQHLLEILGYPLLGQIVGQHVHLRSDTLDAAMLVNYADKRVMHDTVVSLERRFVDLMQRYGTEDARRERILLLYTRAMAVEERIVAATGLDPLGLKYLNLIPIDDALDRGLGIGRKDGAIEMQDEDVQPERIC